MSAFPDKTDDHLDEEPKPAPPPASHTRRGRRSQPSLASSSRDDVEKMKERAEKNQTFVYVKVPEVPLRLSYKGEKEKNLEDLHDCSLVLPTLELHNRTCTWLDLLMVVKSTTRKVLLSQAIKQKLQIKSHQTQGSAQDDANQPQEEDKARLLLGAKLLVSRGKERMRMEGGGAASQFLHSDGFSCKTHACPYVALLSIPRCVKLSLPFI
ncbi:hypothetical protein HPB48_005836 [Haemaphysalis longicornis]|uniref:Uncharacterized protein n=1 Tax=Haemaphysalis longicornis TaxID=44386 RepID=A0A9J6GPL3_HAELO|nr:hypothetical protein HPB48_005836 [Haemaphysalis longicornis]